MKKYQSLATILSIFKLIAFMAAILIAFTGCKEEDDFVAVTSISGVPTVSEINAPLTLTATVSPSNATNQTIVWSVKDAGTTGAGITSGNTLTATAAGTTTVTATIANGATKNTPFTSDFTIEVNTDLVVSGVIVTPATSDVPKGYSLEFIALVSGGGLSEADRAVTWTVAGGMHNETAITANGILSIAANETAEILIITATSATNNSKSGTATVRVYELQNFHEDVPEGSEVVEIEYRGRKILCDYINGLYFTEGDIVIRDDNKEIENSSQNSMPLKAAMNTKDQLWRDGKVFYYKDNINATAENDIRNAMEKIQLATNSNIKFIELLTPEAQEYKKNERIRFIHSVEKKGNWSYLGWINYNDYQDLSLHEDVPSALHEICHALGLIHEHSRPDRDEFVFVDLDNIQEDKQHNFDKVLSMKPYEGSKTFDFESVMIYPSFTGYEIDKSKPSIKKLSDNSTFQAQRGKLTAFDNLVLNEMYPARNASPDIILHSTTASTTNSCTLTGEVIYEGHPAVTEWGMILNGDIRFPVTGKDPDNGRFSCNIDYNKLKPSTTYTARAYVIQNGKRIESSNLVGASDFITFKTPESTTTPSAITMTTAKSGEMWLAAACVGTMTVNWGDGSSPETTTMSGGNYLEEYKVFEHRYSNSTARTITITGNITHLACYDNELTNLNVNGCTSLEFLECSGNELTNLNVSGCTALKELFCDDNQLTNLNVNGCTALEYLECSHNKITSEIPGWFSQFEFSYDQRYSYDVSTYTDKGVGWWYPGEPWNPAFSPRSGTFTSCTGSSWDCNSHTFYYGQITATVTNYYGTPDGDVYFSLLIAKCDFNPFTHSGIAYVNIGQTCTTAIASEPYSAGDNSIYFSSIPLRKGTTDYYVTVASANGEYYSANKITVTF